MEALERLRIPRHFVRKKFQRHEAPQIDVFCLVNHPHPAAAELLDDAVM
jgi:hypothetical protein